MMMYNASYPETIKELIDFHKQILQVVHKNIILGVVGNVAGKFHPPHPPWGV